MEAHDVVRLTAPIDGGAARGIEVRAVSVFG